MQKTFTLPKDLRTAAEALTEQDPCELLYRNPLTDLLSDEFEGISYSPDQHVVDNILAYIKALEAKCSSTMIDGLHIVTN